MVGTNVDLTDKHKKHTVVSPLSHQSQSSTVVPFLYCTSPHKKYMYDLLFYSVVICAVC